MRHGALPGQGQFSQVHLKAAREINDRLNKERERVRVRKNVSTCACVCVRLCPLASWSWGGYGAYRVVKHGGCVGRCSLERQERPGIVVPLLEHVVPDGDVLRRGESERWELRLFQHGDAVPRQPNPESKWRQIHGFPPASSLPHPAPPGRNLRCILRHEGKGLDRGGRSWIRLRRSSVGSLSPTRGNYPVCPQLLAGRCHCPSESQTTRLPLVSAAATLSPKQDTPKNSPNSLTVRRTARSFWPFLSRWHKRDEMRMRPW
jgi:hypothetical protein